MLELIFLKHSHTFYYLKKFVEIGIFISFRGYRSGHEHVQTQLNFATWRLSLPKFGVLSSQIHILGGGSESAWGACALNKPHGGHRKLVLLKSQRRTVVKGALDPQGDSGVPGLSP